MFLERHKLGEGACVLAEIRAEHVPNTILERYWYTSLLSFCLLVCLGVACGISHELQMSEDTVLKKISLFKSNLPFDIMHN
jgi:hypothetical protein